MAFTGKKFLVVGLLIAAALKADASAPLNTDMFQLDMLSYEAMSKQASTKSASCQALEDEEYNDCIKIVFENILSRRDQNDGTISKLFSVHYYKLDDGLRNSLINKIANETIERIKDESAPLKDRATSVEILKNMIAELNPKSSEHRPIIQKISDANLEISESIADLRIKKMGLKTISPSEVAKNLLARVVVPQEEKEKSKPAADIVPASHKKMQTEQNELPSIDLGI
jgi:hypothetical protein